MTSKSKLKIIPLGGIDEIGKNITAMECDGDLILIRYNFRYSGRVMERGDNLGRLMEGYYPALFMRL